jgi:outer membrane receptor protein involved in Fe transport
MGLTHFLRGCVGGVILLLAMSFRLTTVPRLVAGAVCCAMSTAAASEKTDAKRVYNLPRGDAATTLSQFAGASGRQIVFMMDKVRGEQTNAVVGEFAPREALDRMLAGTALIAVQDEATGAFVIKRNPPPPRPRPPGSPEANPRTMKRKTPLAALAGWLALSLGPGFAADASTPGAAAKPEQKEQTVVLSPFTVVSDDKGYQAFNTLSGTRLNSKLEDLGSSISVVTRQQLLDTASIDINDVFRYEASTEGTDNFTSFVRNRAGGVADQVASDPARANRIRGMGTAGTSGIGVNTAWGNFQSNNNIPFDIYNIDAVEISRGPNSNLFGLGAASGTVNLVPSYANPERKSYHATLRFDDWGGHRESVNLNQPLIPRKLALRAAAVKDSKGFTRKPAEEEINRQYATVLFRPFKHTTLRASAERYDNDYRRPNSLTPRSAIPEWIAAGSPTWNPTTQRVRLANGTMLGPFPVGSGATAENLVLPAGLIGGFNAFYSRTLAHIDRATPPSFYSVTRAINPVATGNPTTPFGTGQNSDIRYLEAGTRVMRFRDLAPPFTTGPIGLPLWIEPGISDKSIYDWSEVNIIAPNYGDDKARTFVGEIEQTVLSTPAHLIAARAGLFVQQFDRNRYTFLERQDTFINIDVNETRLDGSPNPFFKRPYIQTTNPVYQVASSDYDIVSGDLVYQLTPQKLPRLLEALLGRQRFGLHVERDLIDSLDGEFAQRVLSDHAFTTPGNRIGGQPIAERFQLGGNTGNRVDYAPLPLHNINGTYPFTWFNNRTSTWVTEPVTVGTVASSGQGARTRTEIRTFNVTAQSYFLRDRLVTTLGWRRDRQQSRTGAGAFVNATTGLADTSNAGIFGPAQNFVSPSGVIINLPGWNYQRGDTKTYGGVLKATSWLSLHYNRSDSFTPHIVRQLVSLDGNMPNPRGFVTEYGLSFTTPDRKLAVRLNRYKTKELDSRGSEVGTLGNRFLDMEGRPNGANQIQPASFRFFVEQIARGRFAAQGNANPAPAQLDPEVAKLMGYTLEQYNLLVYSGPSQPQTVGTTDVTSRGYELEATYNPSRNWRFKFTGAKTNARDDNVSGEILDWWLNNRMPVWTTLRNDQGQLWWTQPQPADNNRTPQTRWFVDQYAPYWAASTNAGRTRTQVREWRFAGLANYEFVEGRLKNFDVGAAVRWESKAAIGYLAGPAETTGPFAGAILFLDNNKPVYDEARSYFDFSAGYRFRFLGDRVRTKVQLNIRNAFENGRLQPIAINPDGVPYAYRIIDRRQFILSASFEL